MSAAAFGLSLAKVSAADFDENDPSTYISSNSFFVYSDEKYVFSDVKKETGYDIMLRGEAIRYFQSQSYYKLRITAFLNGEDGTTIGYRCQGYESSWDFTKNGKPLERDFKLSDLTDGDFRITVSYNSTRKKGTGFSIKIEPIKLNDYSRIENWFDLASDVTCERINENSFNFTVKNKAALPVLTFKEKALMYLVNSGYEAIRLAYSSTAENMGFFKTGVEPWQSSVWTVGKEVSRDFDITGGAFGVSTNGATTFSVRIEKLTHEEYYSSPRNWFDLASGVTCNQLNENGFEFNVAGKEALPVFTFKAKALTYLVNKGCRSIRLTYSSTAQNMGLFKTGVEPWQSSVWTVGKEVSRDFDITGGAFGVSTNGAINFKLKLEAKERYEIKQNWFNTFGGVTCNRVSESSFDFERSDNGGVLSFKVEALAYLVNKGYDVIRVTYKPNDAATGAEISLYPDGEAWNTNPVWANNSTAKTKEFDITSGRAFSLHCAKTPSITSFNLKIEAVDTDIKEVTVNYKMNGTPNKTETIIWNAGNFSANMPTVSVADVKTFGYEYDGKLYKDVASVFAAIGTPESTVTVNVIALRLETQDGAEIRASGTAGLRFTSIVEKSEYFSEFGMILTVRSNVDANSENAKAVGIDNFDKESLSAASLKYIELVSTASGFNSYEEGGNTVFNFVVSNISEENLTKQFIARTYVTVKYADGTTVTYYSNVDFENNARSVQDVAIEGIECGIYQGDDKAFVEENYLKEDVELTAYYGPAVGAYMEDGELLSDGTNYVIATVEDVKAYFDAGFTFICGDDADYLAYRSAGHAADSGYSETGDDGNYANSDAIKLLKLAEAYCDKYDVAYENAKVLIKLGYLEGAMGGEAAHPDAWVKSNVTKFYNHLKTFKCFGGFILRDEPRGHMADTYNLWYKWLVNELGVYRDGYRLHGALLGMGAAEVHVAGSSDDDKNYSTTEGLTEEQFTTYVEKYIAGLTGTDEEYLSFDYYPFTETITRSGLSKHSTSYAIRKQYFQNLEIFSRLASENGFKKGLCVQSTGFYNKAKYERINRIGANSSYTYYGKVSEAQMTYQLYTALAYGYDRISYFTYMQPMNQPAAEWFTDAPYMWEKQSDGTYKAVATEVYNNVKNANAEILEMAKRTAGYKWLGTTYSKGTTATANVFNGTTSYAGGVLTEMTSSYDAIAGCLKDENGRFGFMVVNSDDPRLKRDNTVTLTFNDSCKKVNYIVNGVKGTADITNGKITLRIESGKGVFITPVFDGADVKLTPHITDEATCRKGDNIDLYFDERI